MVHRVLRRRDRMDNYSKQFHPFTLKAVGLLMLSVLVSACAHIPDSINSQSITEISVQAVQQNTGSYKGQTVRWGGVITQVINNADDTWIEVLALPLSSRGKPTTNRQKSQGRFIAKVSEFIDPEVYQEGYPFTVIGILTDKIDGKIGEFKYSFPVVEVQGYHLWSKNSYYHYPYITPGYWYYGYHPYWRFGYNYYGYGVRLHHGYYPYYPFYGHLSRNIQPLGSSYRTSVFAPSRDIRWPTRANPRAYAYHLRQNQHNLVNGGYSNNTVGNSADRRATSTRRSASESRSSRPTPQRVNRNVNRSKPKEK